MIDTPITRKALKIAKKAHRGQRDKAGRPYIEHPLNVAEFMGDEDTCVVALLHDVVEDTKVTMADLEAAGFTKAQLAALRLLTHDKSVSYMDYIRRIKDNEIARTVKLADLAHNLDLSRIPNPTVEDYQRLNKYAEAQRILTTDVWISIRDRFPDKDGRYLVYEYDFNGIPWTYETGCHVCYFAKDGDERAQKELCGLKNVFFDDCFVNRKIETIVYGDVKFWMELPESPKVIETSFL